MQTSAHTSFTAPICKDCKHYKPTKREATCHRPDGPIFRDVVYGTVIAPSCAEERGQDGSCGATGAKFEPAVAADESADVFIGTTNETSYDRLPRHQPATLLGITAMDHAAGLIGLTLATKDGVKHHLRITKQDAEWCAQWITGQMKAYRDRLTNSQSDTSSGIPSSDGSPNDGQNVLPSASCSAACCGVTYDPSPSSSNITTQRP